MVAFSLIILTAMMCKKAGSTPSQAREVAQPIGSQIVIEHEMVMRCSDRPSALSEASKPPPSMLAKLLERAGLPETLSVATRQVLRRSRYVLAARMLLESGDLVSTPPGSHTAISLSGKAATAAKNLNV